jgi:uncharacterized protein (TIGR02444 family)
MQQTSFADSVWPNMILLYLDSRVSDLCLSLQDEFDADVPVLLLLVLADQYGLSCEKDAFDRFVNGAAVWRDRVVRPLRSVRQAMKGHCATDSEAALREEIKRVELLAEKLHVARLAEAFPMDAPEQHPKYDLADRYLADCGLSGERRSACLLLFDDVITKLVKIVKPAHLQNHCDRVRKTTVS